MLYKSILKPYLFKKDAEEAHELAINTGAYVAESDLFRDLTSLIYGYNHPGLKKEFWGLEFPNPVGLAAGFDKNGVLVPAMEALGFGFVEVGSITAEPSKGNPKPRAFRLPEDESLINRMGLNNEGAEAIVNRLKHVTPSIPLGINIAKTHSPSINGEKALEDYLYSYNLALDVADYITVNISCPNTKEGKTFEDPTSLKELLQTLNPQANNIPTLIKFSVDTTYEQLSSLITICEEHGIDGYVATNTSSQRDDLSSSQEHLESIGNGGLSGKAIEKKSTQVIKWLRSDITADKPIIGVGGIHDVASAKSKLDAGADLLQIYTGMVYEGPGLIKKIKKGLLH